MRGESLSCTLEYLVGHSALDPVEAQRQKAGVKPSQFLMVAVLCCSCASQHTGTAIIEMEKPAAPPPKPRTLSEARQAFESRKTNAPAQSQSLGPLADFYDWNLRRRIDKRWRELVAKSSYPPRAGKVVVEFKLNFDGKVSEFRVTKNEVGEWGGLCREAIEQTAPYGLWPPEMRQEIRSGSRDIRFTFDYRYGVPAPVNK